MTKIHYIMYKSVKKEDIKDVGRPTLEASIAQGATEIALSVLTVGVPCIWSVSESILFKVLFSYLLFRIL